uniref:Uncharacterized protein n=1 Tax=Fagus sylvatica TaxID=28930 RepID=A0A2N9EPF3_FAGSY
MEAVMKLLQRREEGIRQQQWSLPPWVSQGIIFHQVEFHGFRVSRGGVRFLEALWKKYGNCVAYLKLGVYIGGSMQTLLYCVLAHMECPKLEDVFEIHILEWKALVQEIIREGFKFNFILNYLRRLTHDMFKQEDIG